MQAKVKPEPTHLHPATRRKFSALTGMPIEANPQTKKPEPIDPRAWVALPMSRPIKLIGRSLFACPWPIGEPDSPAEQLCCGKARRDKDAAYCADHMDKRRGSKPWPLRIDAIIKADNNIVKVR